MVSIGSSKVILPSSILIIEVLSSVVIVVTLSYTLLFQAAIASSSVSPMATSCELQKPSQ